MLATLLGPVNLILIAVVLIEAAVHCAQAVIRRRRDGTAAAVVTARAEDGVAVRAAGSAGRPGKAGEESPIGGSVWAGLRHTLQSRYLIGIMAFILLFTVSSSLVYFQQAEIIAREFSDRARRTAVFASIDLVVNLVTIVTQIFLTARVLRRLGVGATLAVLPIISVGGFLLLGIRQALAPLILFQVLRRSSNYALSRPAREILFTVLDREDKYKAKNLIDTLVYRSGDQLGAWLYALLILVGFSLRGVSFVAVGLCLGWLLLAFWLGARQASMGRPGAAGASGTDGTLPSLTGG